MKEPLWISKQESLIFHDGLLADFGGLEGIRDEGLLESALNRPLQLFNFGTPTLPELAAAYALGIAKNHPFLDGNKRCALFAAIFFLETNGMQFTASEEEAVSFTLGLASGGVSEAEYAEWLKANCRKAE
jgi:death-on-curing protein